MPFSTAFLLLHCGHVNCVTVTQMMIGLQEYQNPKVLLEKSNNELK